MHRSRTTALAAVLLAFGTSRALLGAGPEAIETARAKLDRGDAPGAVAFLEAALPAVKPEHRPALLGALADAYEAAAKAAEAAGRSEEAEDYRENLAILRRKPRSPAPAPLPSPTPAPKSAPVAAAEPTPLAPPVAGSAEVALPAAGPPSEPAVVRVSAPAAPEVEPPPEGFVAPLPPPSEAPKAVPPRPAPVARPEAPAAPALAPTTPAPVTIEEADADFLGKRYEKAGAAYAALNRNKKLPADRRDHWAYCRAVGVVRRINARPAGGSEWAAIDAEIDAIESLSPANWFADYLRNRASERNPGGKASKSLRPNQVVVRGASPEGPPAAPAPAIRPAGPLPNLMPAEPTPAPAPTAAPTTAPPPGTSVPWGPNPVVSENFQVLHVETDRALAEQVAKAAEAARTAQLGRWGDPSRGLPWSPRCEIVLFPTASDFARETGQAADSPGFSTMSLNEGRVVLRRLLLRIDHPDMVKAILPHEVTHVILADHFPHKPVPRWADEGMAVLSEPVAEQRQRVADLTDPLREGRLFKVKDLMAMDYPEPRHWPLYYAQSVSLTRFLVERESPAAFLAFVRVSQQSDFESALKQVYRIADANELQARWLAYARSQAGPAITASADDKDGSLSKAARRE